MSRIRGLDTGPELTLRRGLHAAGLRFRVNARALPGRPDLVFARYRVVVFVHGCFWHRHDCHLFRWPGTRRAFWRAKLAGNHARDQRVVSKLAAAGWRVLIVWECALKGRTRLPPSIVIARAARFIRGRRRRLDIRGR